MAQEKRFENKIKKYLDDNEIWYVKYFANGYTKKGVPDILACVNGRFFGIEVKAEKGRASPIQLYNIEKIKESGGVALVVRPSEFEKLKEIIKKELYN